MKVEDVIEAAVKLCREFNAKEVILFGSRAKDTAIERSDIDIVNMDDCKNELLLEDIRQYGREI